LLANFIDFVRNRTASIVMGRVFGTHSVGIYSMSSELANLATTEFAAPINRAAFSKYSESIGKPDELRSQFLDVSTVIWAVGLPAATGIGLCAAPIIVIVLGAQWLDAVPVLQILAIGGALEVMAANTHTVYWAIGKARFVSILSATGMAVFVPTLVVLMNLYGLVGAAMAFTLAAAVVLPLNYAALMRALSLTTRQIALRNWRVVAACAVMAALVHRATESMTFGSVHEAIVELAVAVPIGIAAYFGALFAFWAVTGRPDGPEHLILQFITRVFARITSRRTGPA
jgi:lipopolysaccharide exporter